VLEPVERKAAKERQRESGGAEPGPVKLSGPQSLDRVAAAVGMPRPTLAKAREVVEAARKDPKRYGNLPSEAVAIADALEPMERKAAKERQLAGAPSGKFPEGSEEGRTLHKVAAAVGMPRVLPHALVCVLALECKNHAERNAILSVVLAEFGVERSFSQPRAPGGGGVLLFALIYIFYPARTFSAPFFVPSRTGFLEARCCNHYTAA